MATPNSIIDILRRSGVLPAADLVRLLGVSAATLSRLVRAHANQVLRLGRTRGARYGLLNPVEPAGAELPVWRVDESGAPHATGSLFLLHGPATWWTGPRGGRLFDGLPPFIADMAPQGFLGRAFSLHHPELRLPERINDWSDEHIIQAVALRGEDCAGNLIIGHESMDRFLRHTPRTVDAEEYPAITRDLALQAAGSSAAGEFPKFANFDGKRHVIVKFTSGDGSPADRRWSDLLVCESIAADTLRDAGYGAVAANVRTIGSQRFLVVERFDRVGTRGRIPILTLAAVDAEHYGDRDNWVAAGIRLHRDGMIPSADLSQLRFLEAFGQLIGNSDRHFGNISFFWDPMAAGARLRLTPTYDMLPMGFAPNTGGMVVDRPYEAPQPGSITIAMWEDARRSARQFWELVAADYRVSDGFRSIAREAAKTLANAN